MILEELGPKEKVFEDLDPGDYLFEIAEPGEKGWLVEFTDKDDQGQETNAKATYINWRLRVVQPEESENRNFFHMTMISATDDKIAKAKKPYNPRAFTFQFLGNIGVGIVQNGEVTILDEYLARGGHPDLNKMIGVRFWGSVRVVKRGDREFLSLTKCWKEA